MKALRLVALLGLFSQLSFVAVSIAAPAELRNPTAQEEWERGVALDRPDATPAQLAQAVQAFQAAAFQGLAAAYVSLGVMQALGRGTPVDYGAAMDSYRAGARLGEPHGMHGIGTLHALGQGTPVNLVEALGWFLAAQRRGNPQSDASVAALKSKLSADEQKSAADRVKAILTEFPVP